MKKLIDIYNTLAPGVPPGTKGTQDFSVYPFTRSNKQDHHGYLTHYEKLFEPYLENDVKVLEIGVLNGSSLALWSMYFSKSSTIVGIDSGKELGDLDIKHPKNSKFTDMYDWENTDLQYNCWLIPDSVYPEFNELDSTNKIYKKIEKALSKFNNVHFIFPVDAYNIKTLDMLADKYGKFDIIIDDALHNPDSQSWVIENYGKHLLNSNGMVVVEDINSGIPQKPSWEFKFHSLIPCRHDYKLNILIKK